MLDELMIEYNKTNEYFIKYQIEILAQALGYDVEFRTVWTYTEDGIPCASEVVGYVGDWA